MVSRLAFFGVSRSFRGPRDYHAEAQITAESRYQSNQQTSLELFGSINTAADQADLRCHKGSGSLTFSCARAWEGSHAFVDPHMGRDALPNSIKICSKAAAVKIQELLQPQILQTSLPSRLYLPSSTADLSPGATSFSHHFDSDQERQFHVSLDALIKDTAVSFMQLSACMLEEPLVSLSSTGITTVRVCMGS